MFTFAFPQRKYLSSGEKHKSKMSKGNIWKATIKKKKSVSRLVLEGNFLAQLQKVDKDLKNLLMMFLKSHAMFSITG